MLKYFVVFFVILITTHTFGQRVYHKTSKIGLENFSSLSNDGLLTFEVEVRVSDCISHIELVDIDNFKIKKNIWDRLYDFWWFKIMNVYDFSKTKKITKEISEEDYQLKDMNDGQEHILMKVNLLNIKSLFRRKETTKRVKINLYSLSGKKIYDKNFSIKKLELIQNKEVKPIF